MHKSMFCRSPLVLFFLPHHEVGSTVTRSICFLSADKGMGSRGDVEVGCVKPPDVVYDLGLGDGAIVSAAARDFGAHSVGIDIKEIST